MAPSRFFEELSSRAERAALAMRILVHPNISLADSHVSGVKDTATARDEAAQSMLLMRANRSCYENAPCGDVGISTELMEAMLELAKTYQYHVSEIAGGSHSKKSRHYAGVAIDVSSINGEGVSSKNEFVGPFMRKCRSLGATEVLGPGAAGHAHHIHAAWPRPKGI